MAVRMRLPRWLVAGLRTLASFVVVVWGLSTLLFFILRINGDPAALLAGPYATPDQVELVRRELGLNSSLFVQYLHFLGDTVRLHFGDSYQLRQPALNAVLDRVPASLLLAFAGIGLAAAVAVPAGIYGAVRRGTKRGQLIVALTLVGQSVPSFVLGVLLIRAFSVGFPIFPSFGFDGLWSLVLPTVTFAAFLAARQTRLIRTYMLEELSRDYIMVARANGYGPFRVLFKHGLRNVAIPVIALLGIDFGVYFGGAVIVEVVFAWPGIGRLMVDGVLQRDFPLVQAAIFVIAVTVFIVSRLVDLVSNRIDPRLRVPA
ncbi:peptide/nickel transport system permease protein [Beijerinckia sp. GAS462]|nr:peptide/nickel transport system permease protein [Beijerinckia sp. GAS462]SED89721.1 peptide/nickel transport system permease protein [Beijerinckia sp. 28-YEA-48]